MKHFTTVNDIESPITLAQEALELKKNPNAFRSLGKHKTLGLIFLNPSLRTRLSTQKAAINLGMDCMVMNMDKEGWALETQDGVVMNGTTVEHIKEAAAVMGEYCDVLGIRSFPKLHSREEDYSEGIFHQFMKYSGKPILSLESATLHPLQSLADLITITEQATKKRPKVVLTWAPHVKALPQAVPNSFSEWMCKSDVEFVIAHPKGYELHSDYTNGALITHNQDEALEGADFVYVKNWSSYEEYGKILCEDTGWMMDNKKLAITNNAGIMHCLPVRRGIELADELLDGPNSLVIKQAANRVFAAQAVLKRMLEAQ